MGDASGLARVADPARVLNLDVNHLSDLVRRPGDADVGAVLQLVGRAEVTLGLSHLHVAQLGAPAFREWPALRSLLRDVPTVLLQPREELFHEEAATVAARAAGLHRPTPRVIARDTSEWGLSLGPIGGDAVDLVEFFRSHPAHREQLRAMGQQYAHAAQMKERAYRIQEPEGPLRLLLEEHLRDMRARDPGYARGLTAEEISQAVGGVRALPAFAVDDALCAYLLGDPAVKGQPGDLADEYIASFAPYVAVTALDRATTHRIRMARLECGRRVTARLAEVPALYARVRAGELPVVPSRW
jgi:hypothetical protein